MNSAQLLDSLKSVNYPGFSRDIVSFGLVNEAIFESGKAIIKLVLTSSDPKLPVLLKAEIEEKLSKHAEISEKEISIVVKKQANGASDEVNDSKVSGIKRIIAIASGKGGVGNSGKFNRPQQAQQRGRTAGQILILKTAKKLGLMLKDNVSGAAIHKELRTLVGKQEAKKKKLQRDEATRQRMQQMKRKQYLQVRALATD